MPEPAAIIDGDGRIVTINAAWRSVMRGREAHDVGASYTDECRRGALRGAEGAADTLAGIDAVLNNRTSLHRSVYACPFDGRMHWYQAKIWPLVQGAFRGAVVVHEDVTREEEARRRVRALAHADPLTNLANRRGLEAALQSLADARAAGDNVEALYVLLDLDGFKAINDRFGHDTGDRVLVITARRLRHAVRAGDTVARMGGDEFAVLMIGAGEMEERLDALLRRLDAPMRVGGDVLRVEVSYGATPIRDRVPPLREMHRTADAALYGMKHAHAAARSAD